MDTPGTRRHRCMVPRVGAWRGALAIAAGMIAGATLLGSAAGVVPARAALPGSNGRIAFALGGSKAGIYAAKLDGSERRRLTSVEGNTVDAEPDWSPDGRRIAFSRVLIGNDPGGGSGAVASSIYVVSADGSGLRRVETRASAALAYSPAWSPDGSQLAFWEAALDSPLSLCLIGVNDRQERCFPIGPPWVKSGPSWSPDGTRVAFVASTRFSGRDVYVLDVRNDSLKQLTHTPGDEMGVDWSPDGTAIAVLVSQSGVNNNGPTELWLVNPETGEGQLLLANGHRNFAMTWSPDSTRLLFGYFDASSDLTYRTIGRTGGTQHEAGDFSGNDLPSWQPTVELTLTARATGRVQLGKTLALTVVLRNASPARANSLLVTETPTPGTAVTGITSSSGSCTRGARPVCRIRRLASHGSVQIHIRLRPTRLGRQTNRVSVSGQQADPQLSNNVARNSYRVLAPRRS